MLQSDYILNVKHQYFFKYGLFMLDRTVTKMTYWSVLMKKILFVSIALAVVLTGCNTIRGMGQDVSKAGSAVSDTATKTQEKCNNIMMSKKPYLSDKVFLLLTFPYHNQQILSC
jgi:predicted small secreted protein